VTKQRELTKFREKSSCDAEIRVNFIQVCRDYTRSPRSGAADQGFLKNLYNAGTAFYTYPG
jgi:hypothetical protein